jgi:LysM repeat protein
MSRRFQSILVILIGFIFAHALRAPVALAEDTVHIVQRGETLFRISQHYNVGMELIAQANNISNLSQIYYGQELIIPDLSEAVENPLIAAEPIHHIIQPGETLASIANKYGLTVQQLAQINNITNPDHILRGDTLTVFASTTDTATTTEALETQLAVDSESTAPTETEPVINGTSYVVQPGETLAMIAQRNGITWPAIVQANNISDPNQVQAGQTIIIPSATSIDDLGIINVPISLLPAPEPTITVGKQIIVDLSDQRTYAYEDGKLVRNVLSSTGLPATPTVRGNFTIQRKYESQLMTGPGYYLPNVQWIMYFYAGYALHGTYWHNNFGQPMSHGCVNMPNEDALWFYEWAPVGTSVLVQL